MQWLKCQQKTSLLPSSGKQLQACNCHMSLPSLERISAAAEHACTQTPPPHLYDTCVYLPTEMNASTHIMAACPTEK